jgi:shikimate dehydrogenase
MTTPPEFIAEIQELRFPAPDKLRVAAIGTLAKPHLSPSLQALLERSGVQYGDVTVLSDAAALRSSTQWNVSVILSPHKQSMVQYCDVLSVSAAASKVVDTVVRDHDGNIWGLNTNVVGVTTALRQVSAGRAIENLLILGAGATARCVALGARAAIPNAAVHVWGRSSDRVEAMAGQFKLKATELAAQRWDLVVNCTTLGERDDFVDTREIGIDSCFQWGAIFFDLNNRVSRLQTTALQRGCLVAAGILMQQTVDACRAEILRQCLSP